MRTVQWLLGATVLSVATFVAALSSAQTFDCSLGRVSERIAPQYPTQLASRPIEGVISVLETFAPDGKVTSSKVLTGPQALRFESEAYIRGWRAEPGNDTRQCPVTVEYRFEGAPNICSTHNEVRVRAERLDGAHVLMHLTCNGW